MPEPFLRQRLRAGETLLAAFVQTPTIAVCEVLAAVGLDVLIAEAEHAPLAARDVATIVAGAALAGRPALVRVSGNDATAIQQALDAGAEGVIVPRVESATEAAEAVALARYPPEGRRGNGPGRAALYGLEGPRNLGTARQRTLVAVQVESAAAVDRLDEILAVPGLDLAFVGPNDLALSLGSPPAGEVEAIIDDVLARALRAGLATGILAAAAPAIARYRAAGTGLIAVGTDLTLLARGARALLAEVGERPADGPAGGGY